MVNSMEKWRKAAAAVGRISLVLLSAPLVMLAVLMYSSAKMAFDTYEMELALEVNDIKVDSNDDIATSYWGYVAIIKMTEYRLFLVTGLVGLWTLPQISAALNLTLATLQGIRDVKVSQEWTQKWGRTQLLFFAFEALQSCWLTWRHIVGKESMGNCPQAEASVRFLQFLILCATIRFVFFLIVSKYMDELDKKEKRQRDSKFGKTVTYDVV